MRRSVLFRACWRDGQVARDQMKFVEDNPTEIGVEPGGVRTEDVFVFPASFAQQRMWFLDQLDPGRPTYNVTIAIRLEGRLRVPVLERTIGEIIRRHEILRTTFELSDGQPVQIVSPFRRFMFPTVDLRMLDAPRREVEAERLMSEEAATPFDLHAGPLFRARLLCLDEKEHILLVNSHHGITDTWSQEIFERELTAIYEAYCAGGECPLPELGLQYGDFAEWQREALKTEEMARQVEYWKETLKGVPALELPTDRARPNVFSYNGDAHPFQITKGLSDELRALTKKQGATLFMTMLAAFDVLLARHSSQSDIAVGTPIANRGRAEIEGLMGVFLNTLVIRTDLGGDPTFREVIGRTREAALGAFNNQDLPFEALVEELQPDRNPGRNPLCQVMLVLTQAPLAERKMGEMLISDLPIGNKTAKFDLTLFLTDKPEGIAGLLSYNTDLFDAERMERLAGHFVNLLEGAVSNPAVADFAITSSGRRGTQNFAGGVERHACGVSWRGTSARAD